MHARKVSSDLTPRGRQTVCVYISSARDRRVLKLGRYKAKVCEVMGRVVLVIAGALR